MTKQQIKYFDGQRDGEIFLFMFRRHIIAMRKGFYLLLGCFGLSCLPTFIFMKIEMLYVALAGFLVGLILFGYHFMKWFFSIYIVSNQRIRQITQNGFFKRSVIDLPLSKVQSVNYQIPGFFGEIFHFGTINILTIVGDLVINNVENPAEIYNNLQDAINDSQEEGYDKENF